MANLVIGKYGSYNPEHVRTSWYILSTNELPNEDNTLFKIENSSSLLNKCPIPYTLPIRNHYYVYIIRHLSDGTTEESPIRKVYREELEDNIVISNEEPVNSPTVTILSNTLESNGSLTFKVNNNINSKYITNVVIYNKYGNVILYKEFLPNNPYTITRDNFENYPIGETLVMNTIEIVNNIVSPVTKTKIEPLPFKVKLLSNSRNIDYRKPYKVVLSNDLSIVKIDVYNRGKLIESVNSDTIINNDKYLYSQHYGLYITIEYNNNNYELYYQISTIFDNIYSLDKSFNIMNTYTYEQIINIPKLTYNEQTAYGFIYEFNLTYVDVYNNYSMQPKHRVNSYINTTPNTAIVRFLSLDKISVTYVDEATNKKSIAILHVDIIGDVQNLIVNIELPDNSTDNPIVILSTENSDNYQVITVIKEGNKYFLKELISNVILGELLNVNGLTNIHLIKLYAQKIFIFGNMEGYYVYDLNKKYLDIINSIPNNYNNIEWISSILNNGNPIYFEKNGQKIIEYNVNEDLFKEYVIDKFIYKVIKNRDSSFSILTNETPTLPSVSDMILWR